MIAGRQVLRLPDLASLNRLDWRWRFRFTSQLRQLFLGAPQLVNRQIERFIKGFLPGIAPQFSQFAPGGFQFPGGQRQLIRGFSQPLGNHPGDEPV